MKCDNYDDAVQRSWNRVGKILYRIIDKRFHWGKLVAGDTLLHRQVYMMREGRHSLHNMIRGDHNLPNRY